MDSSYVPANPAATETAPASHMAALRTKVATDASVAVGFAVLVAVSFWLAGRGFQASGYAGLIMGLVVLGVRLSGLLGAAQMVIAMATLRLTIMEMVADNATLERLLDERDATIDSLRLDLNASRAEANTLRSGSYRSAEQLNQGVKADALALLKLASDTGDWVGRDVAVARLNWTRKRFEAADQLLVDCGAISRNAKATTVVAGAAGAVERWAVTTDRNV